RPYYGAPPDAAVAPPPPPMQAMPNQAMPNQGLPPDAQPVMPQGFEPAAAGTRPYYPPAAAAPVDPHAVRPPLAVGPGPFGNNQQQLAPGQIDPNATGTVRGDQRFAALGPDYQPETGPAKALAPRFQRTMVDYRTKEPAGTIVIDTPNTYLYLVLGDGKAMRYGVGVGPEGFTRPGAEKVPRMAEWPDWHPPEEMIERQPYLPRFMAGGPGNPLGARALYLGKTVYRIHGTNQPSTIGTFVSSGCIRLTNEDIMALYKRVKVGTRVVVLPSGLPMTAAAPLGSRRGVSEVTPYGLPSASDMPRKRYKPEEITAKLQQVDVLVAPGWSIDAAAGQVGITESRYYRWREERGTLKRDELKKPKELANEGQKGLAQGEVSAVRDNAQREFKAEPAGFEE